MVVIAEYSITLVALFGAAQKLGFAMVPLNYRLAAPEIKEISEDADPVLIFTKITSPIYCPNQKIYLHEMHVLEAVQPQTHFDVKRRRRFLVYHLHFRYYRKTQRQVYPQNGILEQHQHGTVAQSFVENRTVNVMPPFHTGGGMYCCCHFCTTEALPICSKI